MGGVTTMGGDHGHEHTKDDEVTLFDQRGCQDCTVARVGSVAAGCHGDLAIGNAIGSSVFNILGVLGFTAAIRPLAANDVSFLDGAILIATSLIGLVLVARPDGIGRLQGSILVATYLLYVITAIV